MEKVKRIPKVEENLSLPQSPRTSRREERKAKGRRKENGEENKRTISDGG